VKLPFVDEHSLEVNASREDLWRALPGACGPTLVGFRVARAKAGEELALEGEHPFSRYALTFAIEEIGEDRLRLRASTHAAFPGRRGSLYRRLVIGSGIHAIVVPRMLRRIGAAAESGNQGRSRRPEPRASRIFGAATGAAAPLVRLRPGRWAQCGFTSAHAALYRRLGLAQQIGDAPILLATTGRPSNDPSRPRLRQNISNPVRRVDAGRSGGEAFKLLGGGTPGSKSLGEVDRGPRGDVRHGRFPLDCERRPHLEQARDPRADGSRVGGAAGRRHPRRRSVSRLGGSPAKGHPGEEPSPGARLGTPTAFPSFNQGDPQIAATGRKAIVLWSGGDRGADGTSIFAATRLRGRRWGEPKNISAERRWFYEPEGEDPQVAITTQGEAIAMWTASDEGHSINSFIEVATQPPRGDWTSPVGLPGSIEGEEPQLAVSPNGEALAIWHAYYNEESGIEVASRPARGKWSGVTRLSNPGAFPQLQIAITRKGEAVAAWEVEGEGGWEERSVQVATRKPDLRWRVRTFAALEDEQMHAPQVVTESAGRAAAVWLRSTPIEEEEYVVATHSPGGDWTESQTLFGTDFDGQAEIAVTGRGEWIAVWRSGGSAPRQSIIQVSSKRRGQAWGAPVTLSGSPGARISRASEPRLAVTPSGEAFVVWRAYNGSRWVIQAARRTHSG
jgi:hypothetical protein